jgi:hypothetical protein
MNLILLYNFILKLMKKILIVGFSILINVLFAQENTSKKPFERKGFVIGVGVGAGALSLKANDTTTVEFSTTLPNIKVGLMVNKRLELLLMLPGANYKYHNKDRGFEGFVIGGQYWTKNNWWVFGGAGLTFDAPAFYTVKDPKSAGFYTGFPALSFATGYEVWHKGKFALDLQYRIFIGTSSLPNNKQREGFSNMFIVGFNWY